MSALLIRKLASQFEVPDGHHNTKVRGSETEMRHFRAFETRHNMVHHVIGTKHLTKQQIKLVKGLQTI